MMLHKGDRGLCGFDLRRLFKHLDVVLDLVGHYLVHRYRRTETERQSDNQT